MKKIIYLILFLIFIHFQLQAEESILVLRNINIINPGSKNSLALNQDVIIKNGLIAKITKVSKKEYPVGAEVIDCSEKFLIPGLWDSHIHFFQSGGLYTRPDIIDLQYRVSYDSNQTSVKRNIRDCFARYLACGITSVIDCGGPDWNAEIADMSRNSATAPDVYFSGPLITSWKPSAYERVQPPFTLANNVSDAIKEVKRQMKYKPNMIKIWYIVGGKTKAEDYFPIVKAICDTAHKEGLPVWVHATELETAKFATRAGTDVLVHLPIDKVVDDEFLKLLKDNNVSIIPTLWVFESYTAVFSKQLNLMDIELKLGKTDEISSLFDMFDLRPNEISDKIKKRMVSEDKTVETSPIILESMKKVQDYGINIAAGTDAGNIGVLHGPSLFHEFALMKKAGLTDEEILKDATVGASKLYKINNESGIAVGKKADLVILDKNPLVDIQNTQSIYRVIKKGAVLNPDTLIKSDKYECVKKQLNAYNDRNINTFLDCYTDDVEIYEFPNKLVNKGKDELRKVYVDFFERAGKKLHCKIEDRLIYGNYVFDKEYLTTAIPGREQFTGQAIYEIKENKIKKVWFIK